jgi:hypothetical protein
MRQERPTLSEAAVARAAALRRARHVSGLEVRLTVGVPMAVPLALKVVHCVTAPAVCRAARAAQRVSTRLGARLAVGMLAGLGVALVAPFEMSEDASMLWLKRRELHERHRCGCMCELHLRDLHAHQARLSPITTDEAARVRARGPSGGANTNVFLRQPGLQSGV